MNSWSLPLHCQLPDLPSLHSSFLYPIDLSSMPVSLSLIVPKSVNFISGNPQSIYTYSSTLFFLFFSFFIFLPVISEKIVINPFAFSVLLSKEKSAKKLYWVVDKHQSEAWNGLLLRIREVKNKNKNKKNKESYIIRNEVDMRKNQCLYPHFLIKPNFPITVNV